VNYLVSIGVVGRPERRYVLKDPVRLLEKISFDRPLDTIKVDTFRLTTTDIDETELVVSSLLEERGVEYAFTVFSGLRRYYEYHLAYPMVHLYTECMEVLDDLEFGEGVIQVVVLKPDRGSILGKAREVRDVKVCSREQVIVDLFSTGFGRDAAIKLLEAV